MMRTMNGKAFRMNKEQINYINIVNDIVGRRPLLVTISMSTTGPKLYGTVQKRKHVGWIPQPRTGHCHLNEYLHHFNVIASPMCECGAGKGNADHFLLSCELYDEQRDALRRRVSIQCMSTSM